MPGDLKVAHNKPVFRPNRVRINEVSLYDTFLASKHECKVLEVCSMCTLNCGSSIGWIRAYENNTLKY